MHYATCHSIKIFLRNFLNMGLVGVKQHASYKADTVVKVDLLHATIVRWLEGKQFSNNWIFDPVFLVQGIVLCTIDYDFP